MLRRHFQQSIRLGLRQIETNATFTPKRGRKAHVGIVVVPQAEFWVIERLGKFHKTLEGGLHFLVPILDSISYRHTTKEVAFPISSQMAITKDNVQIHIVGVVYVKVIDPVKASYAIEDPWFAITNLAQTTMSSEIGKLTLDRTFSEGKNLNTSIVSAIERVAQTWGLSIERYEIKQISVADQIKQAMELEAEAERKKRRTILESEGQSEYDRNVAEGRKRATILTSEAQMSELQNLATGEAFSIRVRAQAVSEGLKIIGEAIKTPEGEKAVSFQIAKDYIAAFEKLAQKGNSVIIPSNVNDVSGMITQAVSIYKGITKTNKVDEILSKEQAIDELAKNLEQDKDLASKLKL